MANYKGNHSQLKSWKKGQSGNPKGAPPSGQTLKDLYKKHLNKSISHYLNGDPLRHAKSAKEALVITDLINALNGNNSAINRVIERTEGKTVKKQMNTKIEQDPIIRQIKNESGGDPFKIRSLLQQELSSWLPSNYN